MLHFQHLGMAMGNSKHAPVTRFALAYKELSRRCREAFKGHRDVCKKLLIVCHGLEERDFPNEVRLEACSFLCGAVDCTDGPWEVLQNFVQLLLLQHVEPTL